MTKLEDILPPIIDNIEEATDLVSRTRRKEMAKVLNLIFSTIEPIQVRICTGFFSPSAWKLVGEGLSRIPPGTKTFKMIIGTEYTDTQGSKRLQEAFDQSLRKELSDLELSMDTKREIASLIAFLKRDDVEVGLQKRNFAHGKMYWFKGKDGILVAIVGSSNFTIAGLQNNIELNIPVTKHDQLLALAHWFDSIHSESDTTYKATLIDVLENSKLGSKPRSPYEVHMKILYEVYKHLIDFALEKPLGTKPLSTFQRDGVRRLLRIIKTFGGAMLADSVGLGKTVQAYEVIKELQSLGSKRALVICSAGMLKDWMDYTITMFKDTWVEFFSMETLPHRLPPDYPYDIIIVDESHNFRNSKTKRYKALELLLAKNPDAKVLLLTATPINTGIEDLRSQVMLITKSRPNYPPFYDLGIFDLFQFFRNIEGGEETIDRLRESVIVSRSRREIKIIQAHLESRGIIETIGGYPIRFPNRTLDTIEYCITSPEESGMDSQTFYNDVLECLDALKFPYYNIEKYKVDTSTANTNRIALGENLSGFMETLLLKRMESSLIAFASSIQRQITLNDLFRKLLAEGIIMYPSRIKEIYENVESELETDDADVETAFINAVKEEGGHGEYCPDFACDLVVLQRDIDADAETLEKLRATTEILLKHEDKKLAAVMAILDKHRDSKILLFSYFKDTASYVYEFVRSRGDVALLTGSDALFGEEPIARETIIDTFAPLSNIFNEKDKEKAMALGPINLLVCTDVISEGKNLQDASVIINYDLHWNPVRIIQRIGRIDRLKSPHTDINVYNCFPEKCLDKMLDLVQRLVNRLELIGQAIELDGAVLKSGDIDKFKTRLIRMKGNDESVIQELEDEVELAPLDEKKQKIFAELLNQGITDYEKIPLGIYSGMIGKTSGLAVVMRAIKGDQTLILHGFKPDDSENPILKPLLRHGIVTNNQYVESFIECEPTTPRYLPEDDRFDDTLFKDVYRVTNNMRELMFSKDIIEAFHDKFPMGNMGIVNAINKTIVNAKKKKVLMPDTAPTIAFLQRTRIDLIAKDIPEAAAFKQHVKDLESKKCTIDEMMGHLRAFIAAMDQHLHDINKSTQEKKQAEPEMRFELLGFMKIKASKDLISISEGTENSR